MIYDEDPMGLRPGEIREYIPSGSQYGNDPMGLRPGPIYKHVSSSSVYCNDPMGLKPKHSIYTPSFADV